MGACGFAHVDGFNSMGRGWWPAYRYGVQPLQRDRLIRRLIGVTRVATVPDSQDSQVAVSCNHTPMACRALVERQLRGAQIIKSLRQRCRFWVGSCTGGRRRRGSNGADSGHRRRRGTELASRCRARTLTPQIHGNAFQNETTID